MSRIARDVRAILALSAEHAALRAGSWWRRRKASEEPALDRAGEIRRAAVWQAAAVGAVASLPAGPLLGVAASVVERTLLAEIEARASARLLALVEGRDDRGAAGWDLGALRAGVGRAASLLAEGAVASISAAAAKELCLALPRFGLKALLGPVAPAAEATWGGLWSAVEMARRLAPVTASREAQDPRARDEAANLVAFAPLGMGRQELLPAAA